MIKELAKVLPQKRNDNEITGVILPINLKGSIKGNIRIFLKLIQVIKSLA